MICQIQTKQAVWISVAMATASVVHTQAVSLVGPSFPLLYTKEVCVLLAGERHYQEGWLIGFGVYNHHGTLQGTKI